MAQKHGLAAARDGRKFSLIDMPGLLFRRLRDVRRRRHVLYHELRSIGMLSRIRAEFDIIIDGALTRHYHRELTTLFMI